MEKIVRLGSKQTYGLRWYSVYCKISFEGGRLSICGVEGPLASGNALGSCGQISMGWQEERNIVDKLAPGWTTSKLRKFFETWDRWHLNDMRAACEHQRARGETWKTHPSAECPDCGYKLGHAWLKEEVPQEVLDFLSSLPDTDQKPAWV